MKMFGRQMTVVLLSLVFISSSLVEAQESGQDAAQKASDQKKTQEDKKEAVKKATATGFVYVDVNNDGKYNEGDIPQPGVYVSNGTEIVATNSKGRYDIEVDDDSIIFLIKPRGRRTKLDKNKIPRFYYIHKPKGSPESKYPGVKPTGKLPESIDFPLYKQDEPDKFEAIMFGDPQARNLKEIGYVANDVVKELIGSKAAFGVTLGDILFDDLSLFPAQNQTVGMIGIPWYNVIGNHDINLDAKSRKHVNETFERVYGPSYYSFNYGQVHFVVLDNIDWIVPLEGENTKARYAGGFGKAQLAWLKKDLSLIDENQMVVLLMHIPIHGCSDAQELYRLIEKRPLCISMSGHTHYHAHRFLKKEDGWRGEKPHHHIINVTVSGSWWSGQKDERGIPHATMSDGAPNGYSILSFDGKNYQLDFKAAGRSKLYQMEITVDDEIEVSKLAETKVHVNVFNGSEKSKVEMRIDNSGDWRLLTKKNGIDPRFRKTYEKELKVQPLIDPALTKPKISTHMWNGSLPTTLKPGHHLLTIRSTDMHGRVYKSNKIIRVFKAKADSDAKTESKNKLESKAKPETKAKQQARR